MQLAAGSNLFLMDPQASKTRRVLHAGTVLECHPAAFVATFDPALALAVGAAVVAFAEVRGKFFQQGTIVADVRPGGTYALDRQGEPVSAEQRQTFRVSVALAGLTAQVGRDKGCPVVDVSPEGFGLIVPAPINLGTMVRVVLTHADGTLTTTARVQTAKPRPDGTTRLGFLAPDRHGDARRTLQAMTGTFQRQHLRRLAGAA